MDTAEVTISTTHEVDWTLRLVLVSTGDDPAPELHRAGCSHDRPRGSSVLPWPAPLPAACASATVGVAPCARS